MTETILEVPVPAAANLQPAKHSSLANFKFSHQWLSRRFNEIRLDLKNFNMTRDARIIDAFMVDRWPRIKEAPSKRRKLLEAGLGVTAGIGMWYIMGKGINLSIVSAQQVKSDSQTEA